ncbi:MAG: hypothetical protein IJI54_07075 [Kiritimatiellae bacterium]|nr:hypothetical protein [Kiritimatiellia bacterium]
MNTNTDWLMFRDDATIKEWECETGRMLADVLHLSDPFRVSLSLPSEVDALNAWNGNDDLKGSIRITHPRGLDIKQACYLPFDGVFISRREDGLRPLSLVWSSWLCEAPGVRIVKPASQRLRTLGIKEMRVGLPSGNFIRAELGAPEQKELRKKKIGFGRFDAEKSKYPEWLRVLNPNDTFENAYRYVNEHKSEIQESDQDDLAHRILMTFPVWLKYRVGNVLLAALPQDVRKEMYESEENACASRIFEAITRASKRLGDRFVPLSVGDTEFGFVFVEPNNPVDLAARLTRVKRLQMSRHAMEEIPAEFRQNHPSFMGRLCPVESPESELVGISLQLAQGARINKDGVIVAADDTSSETMGYRANLGWGAGLIPLFQHNDGTRNMMGAKNLRQVLPPLDNREAPAIKSGGESDILKFTKRLTKIGVCPDVTNDKGEMALGHDLLVAYMPWYGWNMEDAIVINKRVVDEHLFDVAVTKRVKKHVRPGWHPQGEFKSIVDISKVLGDTVSDDTSSLAAEGLVAKGATLNPGDVIVRLVSSTGQHVNEIRYMDASPAVVKEINFGQLQKWMSGTLEYVLEKRIPLRLGDKLMGRHGNKGVIGRIEESDKMPRLPNDERLPKAFRNRPIDIILNPHGVISRMNIGQLLETHLGWLAHAGGYKMADLMTRGCKAVEIGIPEVGVIDHETVQDKLAETGLDRQGRIQLMLPDGSKTKSPVVIGFEHIVRLKHIPELKSQARGGGVACGYDSKTGQAVYGRVRGGGQRVGEMEVWALAGHQAECNLAEMLGGKADAVWARDWLAGGELGDAETAEGFPRQMKDWLFAVGIDMSRDQEGKICFSLCTDADKICKRIDVDGKPHEVKSAGGVVKVQTASFACGRKNKKGECGYVFPLERLCASDTGSLRVGDVLAHIGYKIVDEAMTGTRGGYTAMLEALDSGKPDGQLKVVFDDYDKDKDWLKFHIRPANGEDRPSKWPQGLNDVFGYGRFAANNAERERGVAVGKNVSAEYLRECVVSGRGRHTIVDFNVTCPDHPTIPLSQVPPYGEAIRSEAGGLFDEHTFGSLKNVFVHAQDEQWGYIKLPFPVKFPLRAFVNEKEADQLAKTSIADVEFSVIPVLPSRYRLPLMGAECQLDDDLVSKGYRPLVEACQSYQRIAEVKKPSDKTKHEVRIESAKARVNQAVEDLFNLLADALKGKFGILRRNGLGRRVDRSSRLVITPNPELKWNQVAIPPAVLWELMGDRVLPWMKENGLGKDEWGSLADMISGRVKLAEIAEGWSWLRSAKDDNVLEIVADNLRKYLAAHPETLILLNRQPSLHKDSFQAFHPVVLNPEDGEVFQLSPLCCKGFGADFDGDEMVGHYPVSAAAQKEAARMLPDNNLLSAATGCSLAHFDQDFVMGSYWLSEFPCLIEKLKDALKFDCCISKLPVDGVHADKGKWIDLLEHICKSHPENAVATVSDWLCISLEACSWMGVSFGFYDLLEIARKVEDQCKAAGHSNDSVQQVITNALQEFLNNADKESPGIHVAGMAISGARGKKQIRQLIGARGFLSPGTLGYDLRGNVNDKFWFDDPLTKGMEWKTAFFAAMNARSSMCDKKLGTGHAGALTRKLVFALWPFKIVMPDCGSEAQNRSVVTCKAHGGFCAKCYGALPNGELPPEGYPAGLIAAQSIGERGTQLSMQSFHTGTRAFDMSAVRRILSGKDEDEKGQKIDYFDGLEKASQFVARFKSESAYSDILDRHFELLWRVLRDAYKHSLDGVIGESDIVSRFSYSKQAYNLLLAAIEESKVDISSSPIAEVLFNNFASRED